MTPRGVAAPFPFRVGQNVLISGLAWSVIGIIQALLAGCLWTLHRPFVGLIIGHTGEGTRRTDSSVETGAARHSALSLRVELCSQIFDFWEIGSTACSRMAMARPT